VLLLINKEGKFLPKTRYLVLPVPHSNPPFCGNPTSIASPTFVYIYLYLHT
jgi:hypothetical protein